MRYMAKLDRLDITDALAGSLFQLSRRELGSMTVMSPCDHTKAWKVTKLSWRAACSYNCMALVFDTNVLAGWTRLPRNQDWASWQAGSRWGGWSANRSSGPRPWLFGLLPEWGKGLLGRAAPALSHEPPNQSSQLPSKCLTHSWGLVYSVVEWKNALRHSIKRLEFFFFF